MSFNTSFQFHDLTKLSDNMIDFVIHLLLAEAIRRLCSLGYHELKHFDFRKNFGWFKILCHLGSFIIFTELDIGLKKIHLKPIAKLCHKITMYNIASGMRTFSKTEPELFMKIGEFVTTLDTDYKLYKITGVKSAFIREKLPSL